MRKPYPTDLCDAEWTRLRSYLPTPKAEGRPRTHSLRDVFDAIFYVLRACLVKVRVLMTLYPVSYEKDILN